jgi:hypothetical protein
VVGRVYVYDQSSPTLTIPAATELRFGSGISLVVGYGGNPGTLQVDGTAADPVVFTSNSSAPAPGAWTGIYFSGTATLDSRITHAEMSYCGDTGNNACLRIDKATVTVNDLTIEQSGRNGVYLSSDGAFGSGSANLSVHESGENAVRIGANQVGTLPQGGSFNGNAQNNIFIDAGSVSRSQTWANLGIPYLVGPGTTYVHGSNSPILTIAPGTRFRMSSGAGLAVGYGGTPGGLIAEGAAGQPIEFTAHSSSPQPGYWRGIYFSGSALVDSRVRHLVIEYGTNNLDFARMVPGGLIEGNTIRNASACGVRFQNVTNPPNLTDPALNNTFANNAGGNICS